MKRTYLASLIMISGLFPSFSFASLSCEGAWTPPKEAPLIADCPQFILFKGSSGSVEVKYLVRSTPKVCAYEEPKGSASTTSCIKTEK